jgi:hypothetical protein
MSEMIDRVAFALFARTGGTADEWSRTNPDVCRSMARAAIEAMREPTDAMRHAAFDEGSISLNGYRAMIDAALKP